MNWVIWYLLFIVLFAAYAQRKRRMQQLLHKRMMQKKSGKEVWKMNELMKKYIGTEVIISTGFSSTSGTLTKIEDGWAEIETSTGNEIINIEYISRIKEYPRGKKGKKSSVRAFFVG